MYVENRVKIGVACCEIFNRQEYRSWCATMKTAPFMPQIDRKSMISNFKRKKNRTQIRGHKNATKKKILGLNGIPKLTTIHAGNRLTLCKQPFYKIHFFLFFFCYSHRLVFDFPKKITICWQWKKENLCFGIIWNVDTLYMIVMSADFLFFRPNRQYNDCSIWSEFQLDYLIFIVCSRFIRLQMGNYEY